MKIILPNIDCVFDLDSNQVNTIVIENQKLFFNIANDIYMQTQGYEGDAVLSINEKPVPISKNLELISTFIPFDINRKTLLSKINSSIEKELVSSDYYARTMELLNAIESLLIDATQNYNCNIDFSKLNVSTLVKSANVLLADDYISLAEKIIDYFSLVYEYEGEKLFVLVNYRSYVTDRDFELFCETCIKHSFKVVFIDNCEYEINKFENRYIIDKDLCEF